MSGINYERRRAIAQELLGGHRLGESWGGFAPCPGEGLHNGKTGPKDFKVQIEGAPTGFCLHRSCSEDVEAWNLKLRREIWQAENGASHNGTSGRGEPDMRNVAAMPREEKKQKQYPMDREAVEKVVKGIPLVNRDWLRQRSPIDPRACALPDFFKALYRDDERVLIFTRFTSQGDFAWWQGKGGFRLGPQPDVKAVRSELPKGGREGIWFLTNPVDLQWHPVKHLDSGGRKLSRRSEGGITDFRYLVLESDELEEALWLRVLVKLALPIAAVYTSGSRSIHALVKIDAGSKPMWDAYRDQLRPLLTKLGADGGAMSAVRLSRLPFTLRRGSEKNGSYTLWAKPGKQELLWLDDAPDKRGMICKGAIRI